MSTNRKSIRVIVFSFLTILLSLGIFSINSKAKNCFYDKVTLKQTPVITASRENITRTGLEETSVVVNPVCVSLVGGSAEERNNMAILNNLLRIRKLN